MRSSPLDEGCVAVVVAYRSASTIANCVQALVDDPAVTELVVVDNSGDEATARLVEGLRGDWPRDISYVDPGCNLGFAAACNLGIASSTARTIALVNPDVHLTRSIKPLVAKVSLEPRSIVGGGLLDPAGELSNVRREATVIREIRRAVLGSSRPARMPIDGRMHRVDQVDGALLLVERRALQELGGLAETFPLYFEDVELCWRFRREGGGVYFHAEQYGMHRGGVSSGQNPHAYVALRISRQRWLRLRGGFLGSLLGLGLTVVELVTRTVGRRPEGLRLRWDAVAAGTSELLRPGSQAPLY